MPLPRKKSYSNPNFKQGKVVFIVSPVSMLNKQALSLMKVN